jgi:hypothetical protein
MLMHLPICVCCG